MKKLLVLLVVGLLFTSCGEDNKKERDSYHEPTHFKTIVIDDCQYIVSTVNPNGYRGFGFMAHKGNCNNPIHKHNQ